MSSCIECILNDKSLVGFWDFQEPAGVMRDDKSGNGYSLIEADLPIERANEGVFGEYSARIKEGQWFVILREKCPKLNIGGKDAQVTVIAWVKRAKKSGNECEAIAGMWNEQNRKRQYCLFLNLSIHNSSQQVCGHISSVGGPTPGNIWCMDASIGATPVPFDEWQCIAFTYDGKYAKSYLNGKLDARQTYNPYLYQGGIFDGGEDGSDFTVGSVYRAGEMGNFFAGLLGGLAVFNRAVDSEEMSMLGKIEELGCF